jgi:cytochrome c oxidase assembly protein subunit 15
MMMPSLPAIARLLARISLVFTFIVIIAGSVVRMTGSGMGCPDWPKCFGYLVPPTSAEELSFEPGRKFDTGHMVIWNDTLWVAEHPITAGAEFDHADWYKYPKHDYAIFNPLHTWVEYINRLATVVYGIPIMLLSFCVLLLWIRMGDRRAFMLALLTDVFIAYEVWLGKLVVDGNLKENSITLHMLGSLGIVVCLLILVRHLTGDAKQAQVSKTLRNALAILSVTAFVQMLLGTQVREAVDIIAKTGLDRSQWVEALPAVFYIHRSFSILMVALVVWIVRLWMKEGKSPQLGTQTLVAVCCAELFIGIVLAYLDMPAIAQPLHLLVGAIFFAIALRTYFRATTKASPIEA